jgi:hypothetical protein
MASNSWVLMGLVALTSSLARGAEVQLQVGETRVLSADNVQGAALDNPKVAEIRIVQDRRVEVSGKESGEGTVSLCTADGQLRAYPIRVVALSADSTGSGRGDSAKAWPAAIFGGKKIPGARCVEPLEDEEAAAELDDARDLLRQEHTGDAIQKLDRALLIEPDAAVVHLFLGSAWAKLKDQSRGAYSYETFVLSCPDDAKANAVVRMLREFERRTHQTKPES